MARDKKKIYIEVPVSELPPANGYYNVICDYPTEMGLIHWHKDTGWQNGFYNDRVTHWLKAIEISTPTLYSFEELKLANSYLSSLVDDLLSDKPKDNWISVEERLPERNKKVAGYFPNKTEQGEYVDIAINYVGELISSIPNSTAWAFKASHWQPLPQPPIKLTNMSLSKKDRQIVHDKYGGKCAYCGCELVKGWHVDHFEPVVRDFKFNSETGKTISTGKLYRPQNETPENYMPSCAPCNILKGSSSIEGFRYFIQNTINSMNKRFTQYKFAKRYGLLIETNIEVKFYFEKLLNNPTDAK